MVKIMEVTFEEVLPQTGPGVCCCGCCFIVNFVLLILFFPCTITQLGQFKFGLAKNKISGTVDLDSSFLPGRYWIGFWREFIEFPSTLNTIEFSDEQPEEGVQLLSKLVSRDNEGKLIKLDVSIQYRLLQPALGQIYREMTTKYEDVFISELRDRLSKAANEFTISQAWTDYQYVVKTMFDKCKVVLAARGAECWGLQLYGVELDQLYENQLVTTQVTTQKYQTNQANLIQEQTRAVTLRQLETYLKDIKIVNAKATAFQINIERSAIARAEANLVEAQAKVLKIIKDTVNMVNASNGTYTGLGMYMTDQQLVTYQRYVMLQNQDQSHIVVDLSDGLGSLNAASVKKMNSGQGRRLGEL